MRGALVIKYGDPEIADAIASGIESAYRINPHELAMVREEMNALRQREARLGIREVRDANYFRRKIAEANMYYVFPEGNKFCNALWGVYGLIIEVIGNWLNRFYDEMSR